MATSPLLATSQLPSPSSASTAKFAFLLDKSRSPNAILRIHAAILRHNISLDQNPILNLKLQQAYASHNKLNHSLTLFHNTTNPDLHLFTSAINTLSTNNQNDNALLLYIKLLTSGFLPNEFTFSSLLKIRYVKQIHTHVLKHGFGLDSYVASGLVNGYARDGYLGDARKVFDRMSKRRSLVCFTVMISCYVKEGDVESARCLFDELSVSERDIVVWNVMIDGYVKNGFFSEALMLFRELLVVGRPKVDEVTVIAALSAVSQIGAVETGRWIHENSGIKGSVRVCTALIDMYSKCGSLEEAVLLFEGMTRKDVVAWNAMIFGYGMHGCGEDALRLFDEMVGMRGLRPTDVSFIAVLQACAHAGLVNEGIRIFESMREEYGIKPKIEHYGCLVSLLGRAGELKQAYEIVRDMEIEADSVLWSTVLGSCKLHGDFVLGKEIGEYLIGQGNITDSGIYVLISNIYASVNDYVGVGKVRSLMKEKGIVKEPGISTIEIDNVVHEFRAGDRKHSKCKEIYAVLRKIDERIKSDGYVPNTNAVLLDLEEAEKEQSLQVHSERLAIAYGLISTKPGSPLKIFKNLRVCSDCHTVTKLVSKITGRKIIRRDRNRFHHFVDGSCSCGDFW